MKNKNLIWIIGIVVLVLYLQAEPKTVKKFVSVATPNPTDDCYTVDWSPDTTYNSGELHVKSGLDGYLKFSLSSLGASKQIESATLRLYGWGWQVGTPRVYVSKLGTSWSNYDSWTEDTLTHNTGATSGVDYTEGGLYRDINLEDPAQYYDFDVTSMVSECYSADYNQPCSFIVTSNDDMETIFNSNENAGGNPPELSISYSDVTGGDVQFRTTDTDYGDNSQIAFNTACDGSDLDIYNQHASNSGGITCTELYGAPLITNLPGTTISGQSCVSDINLHFDMPFGRHVVCCETDVNYMWATHYSNTPVGTQSSASTNPSYEVACDAPECTSGPCCDLGTNTFKTSQEQPTGYTDENVCDTLFGNPDDVYYLDYMCLGHSSDVEEDYTYIETCTYGCTGGACDDLICDVTFDEFVQISNAWVECTTGACV